MSPLRVAGLAAGVLLLPLALPPLTAGDAAADSGSLFIASAHENPDGTVTLPLHVGTSHGQTVYYIVTDTDDGNAASAHGLNRSAKLANAAGTGAVEHVTLNAEGSVDFPATVNFAAATRQVVPGPQGFPPSAAQAAAAGEAGYSPLIQLPNGMVENAPQVANATGRADKVVGIDLVHHTVTYRETHGFQGGKPVHYISTDASDPVAAALENVTFAPALNAAPSVNDDSGKSARAALAAFTNGQTGVGNGQRQGLNSAIVDGQDPFNVLRWNPKQGNYSPLWDVHLTQWSAAAVASGANVRQTDFGQVQNLADKGEVTGFDGTPAGTAFAASGFIVDCPLVAFGS
ncbi:MAG TPA: hypothetical protein VHV49_01130 [Pseudonocardiaceae bacterium]|nr:hypothetical protein [Pseudonocardiaceae bacterium]